MSYVQTNKSGLMVRNRESARPVLWLLPTIRSRIRTSPNIIGGWSPARVILAPLLVFLTACAAPLAENPQGQADFTTRCADPNVIRCIGFEIGELSENGGPVFWGTADQPVGVFVNGTETGADLSGRVELARDQSASGDSSLKFFMPSRTAAGYAGQFYANFSDDYSIQFGEGEEFYVQWRQKFSTSFVDNRYRAHSRWKQVIVGEGKPSRQFGIVLHAA